MGRKKGIQLFDDKRDGFFSVCDLGSPSPWNLQDGSPYFHPGGLFANVGQVGMGFGVSPNPSDSRDNGGVKVPHSDLYAKYVSSIEGFRIVKEEVVELEKSKKKDFGLSRTAVGLKTVDTTSAAHPTKPSEPGAPTTSNRRRFFSSNPTRRRRSLAYSLPIHIQISGALISNPTRRRFFSSILNRRRHPQSSGSLFPSQSPTFIDYSFFWVQLIAMKV
ncbi:hypothetical protein CMV_024234 [Castanea mollissima]|uniref:Uncharacterized protein n=1 Tax=Castanea mollissima TaxID=60419 RepID=A0A8J4QHD9_9ROSI|nr:hypothetical protein CMV_024234 [Castanea mollissima]